MIDLEQMRKDMEAGTQGDWATDNRDIFLASDHDDAICTLYSGTLDEDARRIARVPQLEREYIALREAADALAMVLDAAIKEHDTADYGHDEENPWTMREWFDASDRAALTAYREATK